MIPPAAGQDVEGAQGMQDAPGPQAPHDAGQGAVLPDLPPEYRRPTPEDFVAAGYVLDDYEAQMELWETDIRKRMAAGESYDDMFPATSAEPNGDAETPREEAPPTTSPTKAKVVTRPSFAYPGHHEDAGGRLRHR